MGLIALHKLASGLGILFLLFGGLFSPEATRSVTGMVGYPVGRLAVSLAVGLFLTLELGYQLLCALQRASQEMTPILMPEEPGRYRVQLESTPPLRFFWKDSLHRAQPGAAALLTGDEDFDHLLHLEGPPQSLAYLTPARRSLILRTWEQMPEALWENGRVEGEVERLGQAENLRRRVELLQELARQLPDPPEGNFESRGAARRFLANWILRTRLHGVLCLLVAVILWQCTLPMIGALQMLTGICVLWFSRRLRLGGFAGLKFLEVCQGLLAAVLTMVVVHAIIEEQPANYLFLPVLGALIYRIQCYRRQFRLFQPSAKKQP